MFLVAIDSSNATAKLGLNCINCTVVVDVAQVENWQTTQNGKYVLIRSNNAELHTSSYCSTDDARGKGQAVDRSVDR